MKHPPRVGNTPVECDMWVDYFALENDAAAVSPRAGPDSMGDSPLLEFSAPLGLKRSVCVLFCFCSLRLYK